MNVSWSTENDEILIDFVRSNEILYNVKNKDYRQTQRKQEIWCELGETINKTGSDCYKRWCYIRDYYIRRKGKSVTGSIGEATKKRCDRLSFLDSFSSTQRNSITNVNEGNNSKEDTQDNNEQTLYLSQVTEDMTFDNEVEVTTNNYIKNVNGKGDNKNDRELKTDDNIKSYLKRKKSLHSQNRLNLLKQLVQRKSFMQNELDENDLFFCSMAKIVKKLPRYEQVQIRMQIGSLVGNAELRNIPSNSPPGSVSPRPSTSGSVYTDGATAVPSYSMTHSITVKEEEDDKQQVDLQQ